MRTETVDGCVGELVLGVHPQEEQLGDAGLEVVLGRTSPALPVGDRDPLAPSRAVIKRPVDRLVGRQPVGLERVETVEPFDGRRRPGARTPRQTGRRAGGRNRRGRGATPTSATPRAPDRSAPRPRGRTSRVWQTQREYRNRLSGSRLRRRAHGGAASCPAIHGALVERGERQSGRSRSVRPEGITR